MKNTRVLLVVLIAALGLVAAACDDDGGGGGDDTMGGDMADMGGDMGVDTTEQDTSEPDTSGMDTSGTDATDTSGTDMDDTSGDATDMADMAIAPSVTVSDQTAMPANEVTIDEAVLPADGFVVIHEDDGTGTFGAVIGNSALLTAGTSSSIAITLDRDIVHGETLYAMLHTDDGNGTYDDASTDPPVMDANGDIVVEPFMVSLDLIPSITANDQTADPRTQVVVAEAVAAENGFVVIHEDSNGAPGPVIGNASVTPGVWTDLTVTLDRAVVQNETLWAMLHTDDGNGTYDDASTDPPVTDMNGDIVMDSFVVDINVAMPDSAASATITDIKTNQTNASITANVAVTYVKPEVGNDPTGFFVQAEQTGPALFVAVDPSQVAVGDIVTFDVTGTGDLNGIIHATSISNLNVVDSGYDVSQLAQDVSAATDLVSALDDYDSELITLEGTVVEDFGFAGSDHVGAQIETAGITGDSDLVFRVPSAILDGIGLNTNCTIDLGPTPMWRFNTTAQPSAWVTGDFSIVDCPAPTVVQAVATDDTTVIVDFDRPIDANSVNANGDQFTIEDSTQTALAVSAATTSGSQVTLTTDAQTGGELYTVTVADTVLDDVGNGIDQSANSATFRGFLPQAVVLVNEVNPDIANGCDMIEIRVMQGGTLENFTVTERVSTIYTFPFMQVATNDIIVLHMNTNSTSCNPNSAVDETMSINEAPESSHPVNYDVAWDVWSTDSGITSTNNVLAVWDPVGTLQDAVFIVDTLEANCDANYNAANSTNDATDNVVAQSGWETVAGGLPASGNFHEADFCPHAAPDSDDLDTSALSIQRDDNMDNNNKDDWTQGNASWGLMNTGQTAF